MFISHLTRILGPFHSLTLPLFHTPPDAGSGSGSSGEGSTGSGAASSGTGGSQSGAAASGGGQSGRGTSGQANAGTAGTGSAGDGQPFRFSDTARIQLEDGRVVTGAQYRDELNAALDADHRSRYQRGYDLLLAEAKRLDLARRGGQQGQGGQPQNGQVRDPLAEIEQLQSVDGRTLANLYRQLEQAGLRPIAQLVSSMQQELAAMRQQMTTVGQRFGSQDEDSERERFHQTLDRTLSTIKVNGLSAPLDAKNEAIRSLAENLHLSYVPGTWRAGEFDKMLSDQVNALFAYFKDALKNEGNVARENLRRNFNVNRGGGSPSGGAGYKHQSPREIAAAAAAAGMFGGNQT